MNQSWTADIPSPEWLYFEDSKLDRYIYFVHEEDDAQVDSFYQMERNMTVFGFGRSGLNKYLSGGPHHFTIGLAEGAQFSAASQTIEAAYHPVSVSARALLALVEPNQDGGDTTLAGCWQFDEGTGDIVYDASIFANHGLLVGATWIAEGRSAGALKFDGKDDYVTIRGYKGVIGTQARTIAAWVRTKADDYVDLISWGVDEPGSRWVMLLTRGSRKEAYGALRVAVGTGFITGSTRLTDGQWHYVAAVLEAGDNPSVRDIRLYVDGELDAITASSSSPINTAAGPDVSIGVCLSGDRHFFDGDIDDVRIYTRALIAAEIRELASAGSQ